MTAAVADNDNTETHRDRQAGYEETARLEESRVTAGRICQDLCRQLYIDVLGYIDVRSATPLFSPPSPLRENIRGEESRPSEGTVSMNAGKRRVSG